MESYQIREAEIADIQNIQTIADITWKATYSNILSADQLIYMLENIFDPMTLRNQIKTGEQSFCLLNEKDIPVGFVSYARYKEPNSYKIHKLYVLPQCQGKGYGRVLIQYTAKVAQKMGATSLYLNVNRYNPARKFYQKIGFEIIREEDIPIGPYWMNDYVMHLPL